MSRNYYSVEFLMLLCLFSLSYQVRADYDGINYLEYPTRTEWQAGGFYEGSFEDGTPFYMNLPYPLPDTIKRAAKDINKLNAEYWYPRAYTGETIHIWVKSFSKDDFTLEAVHQDKNGIVIGSEVFEGSFSSLMADASGVWSYTKGSKKMSFKMRRIFEYKGVDVDESKRTAMSPEASCSNARALEECAKLSRSSGYNEDRAVIYSVYFPVLANVKIDESIQGAISECGYDHCFNDIRIVSYSKSMVTLYGTISGYSQGMAHGYDYTWYTNYAISKGEYKNVSLDYYVDSSPKCLEIISSEIVSALQIKKMSRAEDGALHNTNRTMFMPSHRGILFAHNSYELGGYAEGAPSVFVKREKVGSCFRRLPD